MSLGTFAAENRTAVIVGGGALVIAGALGFILTHSTRQPPPPPPPKPITMVVIQPPKPPPPPPPPPQQKTITPPKMATPTMKPVAPTRAPTPTKAPSAAAHMSTDLHGNSPNAFDLAGSGNGLGLGEGGGPGGSAMGYFESVISAQIRDALQQNPVTRRASAGLEVRLWIDASGVVTQVELVKSSGNPAVDAAITNQVLLNMRLNQAPPPGTPMPVSMSLTGEQAL
jgi:TonB family protein